MFTSPHSVQYNPVVDAKFILRIIAAAVLYIFHFPLGEASHSSLCSVRVNHLEHSCFTAPDGVDTCTIPVLLNCSTPALSKLSGCNAIRLRQPWLPYRHIRDDLDRFQADSEGLAACDCPDPCVETEYTAKLSAFNFPSSMFIALNGLSDGNHVTFYFLRLNHHYFLHRIKFQQLLFFGTYTWQLDLNNVILSNYICDQILPPFCLAHSVSAWRTA